MSGEVDIIRRRFLGAAAMLAASAQPALTIYNQDFAVVRQDVPLDLKSGVNQVNGKRPGVAVWTGV